MQSHITCKQQGLIAEYNSSGLELNSYGYRPNNIWGTDPVFLKAGEADNKQYYYHNDHLGTPYQLTDNTGFVVWSGQSSSFGETDLAVTNTIVNNLRFPGQYYDAESGLHYNFFRYYDPSIGCYITSDPIGLAGGINTYAYVSGNPIGLLDPWGLMECNECDDGSWGPSESFRSFPWEKKTSDYNMITQPVKIGWFALGIGLPFYSDWSVKIAADSFPGNTHLGGLRGSPIGFSLTPGTGRLGKIGFFKTVYKRKTTIETWQRIHYKPVCINGKLTTLDPLEAIIDTKIKEDYFREPEILFMTLFGPTIHNIVGMAIPAP